MIKKVFIGSEAMRRHFPDFNREAGDIDYLVAELTDKSTREVEYHVIPPLWKRIKPDQEYLSANQLYTLKVSHSYWNINWEKTMYDIKFMTSKGCEVDWSLHDELYEYWSNKFRAKRANLNRNTEDFFDDCVEREFSHDDLHEVVKYYDDPLYKNLLVTPDKPLMSKKAFFEQSHLNQIRTAKEEGMAIALERFYLPGKTHSLKVAYMRALKILITSATKGWFPTFMVLNFEEVSSLDFKAKELMERLEELKLERLKIKNNESRRNYSSY
jgi:hypothetical protein